MHTPNINYKLIKMKLYFMYKPINNFYYLLIELSKSLEIKVRDKNKRTNLGNIYLDNIYTVIAIKTKVKVISFTK